MAEKFRIYGTLRNGPAVYGEILPGPPQAELVYYLRDIFLADSALAAYDDRQIGRSDGHGDFKGPVQRRVVAYDIEFVFQYL